MLDSIQDMLAPILNSEQSHFSSITEADFAEQHSKLAEDSIQGLDLASQLSKVTRRVSTRLVNTHANCGRAMKSLALKIPREPVVDELFVVFVLEYLILMVTTHFFTT